MLKFCPVLSRTAADSVVRVARGLWDQWGPRMPSILEWTVESLHEASDHPTTDERDQYTILDGLKLLSDEKCRSGVPEKVSELYLREWWVTNDNHLSRLRDRRSGLDRRLMIRRRYRDGHKCAGGTAETEAGGRRDPGSADSCGRSP